MKGWRYESARHALAARGIRSYCAKSGFIDPIQSRRFKIPVDSSPGVADATRTVLVDKPMSKEEIEELLADIEKKGLQETVVEGEERQKFTIPKIRFVWESSDDSPKKKMEHAEEKGGVLYAKTR